MSVTKGLTSIFLIFFASFLPPQKAQCQTQYREGDWVSYADFHRINDIAVGRDEIYIATPGGVVRYHRYKDLWLDPWVRVRGLEGSIDLRRAINVDYLEETNEVAVLTAKAAYLYNPVFEYWQPTEHSFEKITPANDIEITFLKMPDYNISRRYYIYQGNGIIMDSYLRKFRLGTWADDQWGDWWVGLSGVGVIQMDKYNRRGIVWELGLYGGDVRALAKDKNWLIMAGHNRNGGITLWKRDKNVWDYLERENTNGLESTWINDLSVSGSWLLAATDYGLAQVNLKNGSCKTWTVFDGLWSDQTASVATDGGTIWVGTEGGLNRLYLPSGPIERQNQRALINQTVYRIAVDPQVVWLGCDLGVYRLDRSSNTGSYLADEGGVAGPVYALNSTPTELWAGRLTGIEVIDKKSLRHTGYPSGVYFNGAEVNAILAQDSLVWVGTNQGLWKFDRSRDSWYQYKRKDGLLDNRVYAIYPDGDYLLLGTAAGVTRFFWNAPYRID